MRARTPGGRERLRRARAFLPLLALAAPAVGCAKSCRNNHPYVPYTLESTTAASVAVDAAPPLVAEDAGGGPFAEHPAEVAPPNSSQWSVDGLLLAAPEGKVFVLGLVKDFDGEGHRDAFAIVRPKDKPEGIGEVVFFRGREGGTAPAEVVAAPSDLASATPGPHADAGACTVSHRLGQIGKRTVFVEIGVGCHKSGTPARWIAVLSGDPASRVKLTATVDDPPGAPHLAFDADASDQDGDGIDDLTLRATVDAAAPQGPPHKVQALLRWLDKPSGLSRNPGPTETAFATLAQTAMTRAARSKEAPLVASYVGAARALYAALCPEAGEPRVVRKLGTATFACGAARAVEDLGIAEVRAAVTMGDPLRAIHAFEMAEKPPAAKTAARAAEAAAWITQAWPVMNVQTSRYAAAVPKFDSGPEPSWGALAFESSGKLLLKTAAGVVRMDPATGDEVEAEGRTAWKSTVVSPGGDLRWIETYNPCDQLSLQATFTTDDEGNMKSVTLPIPAPRCKGKKGEQVRVLPIAWGTSGLFALVAGQPIAVAADLTRATLADPKASYLDGAPAPPGSPRSPNGKVWLVPTVLGILVHAGKTTLRRAKELDGAFATLRDCVATDDAGKVACIFGKRVWVGSFDAP